MLKRAKYNIVHELSPQGSRAWLNWVCTKCVVKMGIKSVYRGSFRIEFLGFGSCFSLCVCVCVFFFFFWLYFLGIFSEVLGIFLCWFSSFLVGLLCDCSGVFFGFWVWFIEFNLRVCEVFTVEFLGNLLGCLGVSCELLGKKMVKELVEMVRGRGRS